MKTLFNPINVSIPVNQKNYDLHDLPTILLLYGELICVYIGQEQKLLSPHDHLHTDMNIPPTPILLCSEEIAATRLETSRSGTFSHLRRTDTKLLILHINL